MTLVTV